MAMTHSRDVRRPGLLWSRLHFLVRFLGLAGALAGCAGLILVAPGNWRALQDALADPDTESLAGIGAWMVLGGAALAALALLVETLVVLRVVAGRRSAFAFNAVVQVVLAGVLFAGINAWSLGHSLRFDWTREQNFTLPVDLRERLARLDRDSETTVVVYQRHKTFGSLSDKPDRFDYAAERKVVEKVKDLVGLLREIGPQLRVEVLDVEEEGYDEKLKQLTKDAPALRKAIDAAPENSIFISGSLAGVKDGREYVQQMSFNELYQLDKVQSLQDNDGRGNLVLLGQGADGRGVRPFVRRILDLEQSKPRVGVLVIHPQLTTEGADALLGLGGLRKSLTLHGFEVKDVVLKKGWMRRGQPQEPAADTFEESKLEDLEAQLARVEFEIKRSTAVVKPLAAAVVDLTPKPGEDVSRRLEELSKKYSRELGGEKLTVDAREEILASLTRRLKRWRDDLAEAEKDRGRLRGERDRLDVDRISEARRMTDVKAKLAYALSDCDVLFIPRLTRPGTDDFFIPPRLHRLDAQQVDAVRDFLKAGKPLLACFGPTNEDAESRPPGTPPTPAGGDGVDDLLADLGIHLGRQTILTAADSKAFTERLTNPLRGAGVVQPPPLDFFSPVESAGTPWRKKTEPLPPGPLRRALQVTARSVGQAFNVRMRFPRPVTYEPPPGKKLTQDPVFLLSPEGWKDDEPFFSAELRRREERLGQTDLKNDKGDARERGQFPVGVAVEAAVPESWGKAGKAVTVRVAAVGQGEVFVGNELKPAQERMLLQTVNWLLGRDDYLPQADHPWSYPRLPLTPEAPVYRLWKWGVQLGLPVLFAFVGFVVLLFRRLR